VPTVISNVYDETAPDPKDETLSDAYKADSDEESRHTTRAYHATLDWDEPLLTDTGARPLTRSGKFYQEILVLVDLGNDVLGVPHRHETIDLKRYLHIQAASHVTEQWWASVWAGDTKAADSALHVITHGVASRSKFWHDDTMIVPAHPSGERLLELINFTGEETPPVVIVVPQGSGSVVVTRKRTRNNREVCSNFRISYEADGVGLVVERV
jgi:hypothetical protein